MNVHRQIVCSGKWLKPVPGLKVAMVLLVCCGLTSSTSAKITQQFEGQSASKQPPAQAKNEGSKERAKMWIPDTVVLDQDGKKIHFYSDLVKGKVVAISFIYTTCTAICPQVGNRFAKLQAALGERLGKEVYLISISTDPVRDTPARLKAWGAKFGAKPGWTFITGEKAEMDKLLLALSGSQGQTGYHDPVILIGGDVQEKWTRTYGFEDTSVLTQIIDQLVKRPVVKELAKGTR